MEQYLKEQINYSASQYIISFFVFRGFTIKNQIDLRIEIVKYSKYNKVLVEDYVEYYYACQNWTYCVNI